MNKSELDIVMFNWQIRVSNQSHVRKDHVPLWLTIQSAFDCDWRSNVQGAKGPNAYTSQKLVSEATHHFASFKRSGTQTGLSDASVHVKVRHTYKIYRPLQRYCVGSTTMIAAQKSQSRYLAPFRRFPANAHYEDCVSHDSRSTLIQLW